MAKGKWKKAIHERDSFTCQRCGKKEDPKHLTFQVHHIRPKCLGGSNDLNNLILTCPFCHKHYYHKFGYPMGNRKQKHHKKRRKHGRGNSSYYHYTNYRCRNMARKS